MLTSPFSKKRSHMKDAWRLYHRLFLNLSSWVPNCICNQAQGMRLNWQTQSSRMFNVSMNARAWFADADVVLAVQPPAIEVINGMKEGSVLISFIYADKQNALVKKLLEKKLPALRWSASRASRGRSQWMRCQASRLWPDIMPCSLARHILPVSCRRSRLLRGPLALRKFWCGVGCRGA